MSGLLIDSPEVVKRRRGFLQGLQGILTREQALLAICIWERDFSSGESPFTGMYLYTRNICEYFGKVGRRKELHSALLEALFLPESKLPLDPSAEMRLISSQFTEAPSVSEVAPTTMAAAPSPAVEEEEGQPLVPPLNHTLSLLIKAMLAELSAHHPAVCADCITFVQKVIGQLGLAPDVNQALLNCMQLAKPGPLLGVISQKKAANLIHVMYVWMAETLGPVLADRMLSTAVQSVQRDSDETAFPVRLFL